MYICFYEDHSGVYHAVDNLNLALSMCNPQSTVVATEESPVTLDNGYPALDGVSYVCYTDGTAFINGNRRNGKEVTVPDAIASLIARTKQA